MRMKKLKELESFKERNRIMLKKISITVLSFIMIIVLSSISVFATAYSQTKTDNMNIYTANYKVAETATYHTTGDKRWTYSNLKATYLNGNSGKGVSVSSKTTGNSSTTTTQTTKRTIKLSMTDYNYQSHTSSKTFTWTFDRKTNKFK